LQRFAHPIYQRLKSKLHKNFLNQLQAG